MALVRRVSKTKLSLFLRTQCDLELYLSLFSGTPPELAAAGIPAPLKSRPNVQLVTGAGQDFERDQYKMLVSRLGANVQYRPGFAPLDPAKSLNQALLPGFILQPEIDAQSIRSLLLTNLGCTQSQIGQIPELTGMRPDVLVVRPTMLDDWEILADGRRKGLVASDKRAAISVIDLKNVSESNSSYAAEVCFYAVTLANWLIHSGLSNRFYVSSQLYLWTRPELLAFDSFFSSSPTASAADLINVLLRELERDSVDFLQFMPSVRKFFREDIPRVITAGDANGWHSLDYHVGSRCSACDWLGYRDWLSKADEKVFDANPTHYCVPNAEYSKHLSRVPNLSRGARQVLEANSVKDVDALSYLPPSAPVLSMHTFLKRERQSIAPRALAISTQSLTSDPTAKIVTLARNASLLIHIIITFDASAGRLTGIGLHSSLLPPFGSTAKAGQIHRKGWLVARDTDIAEWSAIEAFIDGIVDSVDKSSAELGAAFKPYAQIYLWERRQYEELCKSFGRHLARVLSMPSSKQRAVAWLFPADDLLEREDGAISPAIVFVKDIIDRVTHLPVTHVSTLLRVAQIYHHPKLVPSSLDSFYSEPFSNGIPRERTFEIWMNTSGVVSWGANFSLPIADAIDRYRRVLANNAFALNTVVARLRQDFKGALKGDARQLNLSTISGKAGVAFDSKLWSQWKHLDESTRSMEAASDLASSGERLEAAYKAIVLLTFQKHLGGNRFQFLVSPESLQAKIEAPSRYLTLGLMDRPGFPLETGFSLKLQTSHPSLPASQLSLPMHRVMRASLEEFDRAQGLATVSFGPAWAGCGGVHQAVLDESIVTFSTDRLFLLESAPYRDSAEIDEILQAIGDPVDSVADPNAAKSMGKAGKKIKPGTDPTSRASRVLWHADLESKRGVRPHQEAVAIAADAAALAGHGLNPSQHSAIETALEMSLSILWGPPGTGKTDTLAALVHSLVRMNIGKNIGYKILITGPNYRAVEVLLERVLKSLSLETSSKCHVFMAFSKSRELPPPIALPPHISGTNVSLAPGGVGYSQCRSALLDSNAIVIVATSAHSVGKVVQVIDGSAVLYPAFDLVVIDESSQVDINLALRPIATLKPDGQLVIAGDHLQMPPIALVDPPVNAEYLVGSVQTYFIDRFNVLPNPLLINYRSNKSIVDYALTLGYPKKLQAHVPDKKLHEVNSRLLAVNALPAGAAQSSAWEMLLDPQRSVCCLLHDDETASQASTSEAKMVASLVKCLHGCMSKELDPIFPSHAHSLMTDLELFEFGVGVVTPHKAQRAAVVTELRSMFQNVAPEVIFQAVDTVERFQGGERQTIIVSFGVGDIEVIQGEEEFLLQLQRINVAVSRAMAKCIVLLPKTLAYHLPSEKKVLKTAKAIKSYIEEFCSNSAVGQIQIGGNSRACEIRWH